MISYLPLLLILGLYFLIHLINLTIIPIFNDESIYLNWGLISLQGIDVFYYSLFDGKQPLLMWVFGAVQSYFPDPLFAGRIVSVILGSLSLIGIYLVSKKLGSEKIAIIASTFYAIIPIFVFYNRQALMESAIAAVGIWMFYLLINIFSEKNKYIYSYFLGLLIGIGFFVKSSVLLFLIPIIIIFIYNFQKKKKKEDRAWIVKSVIIIFIISQVVLLPLYLQDEFIKVLNLNSRFALTFGELLKFPFDVWTQNFRSTTEIIFWYVTPLVLIISLFGMIRIWRESVNLKYLLIWVLVPLFILILTAKNPSTRYTVSFLPFVVILFAFGIDSMKKKYQIPALIVSIIIPIVLSVILIFSPLNYFGFFEKVTDHVDNYYISGWTSGNQIKEVSKYIENEAKDRKIRVYTRVHSGNPEDALFVYLNKNTNVSIKHFWISSCNESLYRQLISSPHPVYFVRSENNGEEYLNCFEKIHEITNPEGKTSFEIYKLKSDL